VLLGLSHQEKTEDEAARGLSREGVATNRVVPSQRLERAVHVSAGGEGQTWPPVPPTIIPCVDVLPLHPCGNGGYGPPEGIAVCQKNT
jgi:hypothetical protein